MRWQAVRGFLARRLSRQQYLGLHLTVGLLVSLILLVLFAVIARQADRDGTLTRFDTALGEELAAHRRAVPAARVFFMALTFVGSFEVMTVFVLAVTLVLWLRGRRQMAFVWLFALVGAGVLNQGLKAAYGRSRPPFKDAWVYEENQSFPSGHSTASLVGFGLLAYLLIRRARRRWLRAAIIAAAAVLVFLIGFSRIYLGAHYFSDVIGGYSVGAAWLATCLTGIETVRRRRRQHPKAA